MDSFEFNKVFAAVLVAGIVAMLGGFVAERLVHPHELAEDAVFIAGAEAATGAGHKAKEPMPEPVLALIATADIAKGEKLSKACAACHGFENGGPNKVGPNLWGVVGRAKATHGGFDYSASMKETGGSWSYADLNKFLWKPKKFIDGTKMNFIGLKKPEDRAAIIAWLRTLSASQEALPSAAEIAQEEAELNPASDESEAEGEGSDEAAHH